jgi:hypothetical protein
MKTMQHRRAAVAVCAVLVALAGQSALAQTVYKWTDANGVVHFADAPPPQVKDYEKNDMPRRPAAPPPPEAADTAPATGEATPAAKGPAQVVLSGHEEIGVGPALQSFTGTVKNEGGAEAVEVAVAVRVVDPNSGDECVNTEIDVEPSTLPPGGKGTFEAEIESPCFRGATQADLHVVWR